MMTNAVTIFDAEDFSSRLPALKQDMASIIEAVQVNLRGRRLRPLDMEKIRIPTGGNTTWSVPTLSGSVPAQAIDCVVVGVGTPRVYWAAKYGEGESGAPPECRSDDGMYGRGLYGVGGALETEGNRYVPRVGSCDTCPMNQWPPKGSKDRKKPCSELRMLFIYPAGELGAELVLPMVVIVSPGSFKAVDDYLVRLSGRGLPYFAAATRLELSQAKNGAGLVYSQMKLSSLGRLSPADHAKARGMSEGLATLFGQVSAQVTQEDVEGGYTRI